MGFELKIVSVFQSEARLQSIRYTASRKKTEQWGKVLYALATNSGIYQEYIMNQ